MGGEISKMRKRFGRVLALVLAMSLILANTSAASATDVQADVTEPIIEESVEDAEVEEIQTEQKEELAEEIKNEEEAGALKPVENKEESQSEAKEQAAQEETVPVIAKELRYENEDVTVVVSEKEAGAISDGTSLKVVPITATDDATKEQYQEVEKQIQEKAGKEEKEIAGFLAYDITLVDVQGNEVEPNSSVKVSMEYKKETIPEGLSEEKAKSSDVTVYHLEEDENGLVKDVVDMGAAKQVENISATEKNEVKKLEMVTESFSTFTIVWKSKWLKQELKIQVVDMRGKPIGTAASCNLSANQSMNVKDDIANKIDVPNDYVFQQAKIGKSFEKADTRIYRLRGTSTWGKIKSQYSVSTEQDDWKDVGENTVYFIFAQNATDLKTIETEDTAKNIDIALYDYDSNENLNSNGKTAGLIFHGGTGERYNQWIGYWKNGEDYIYRGKADSLAVQGIVERQLRDENGRTVSDYIHSDKQLYPKLRVGSKKTLTQLLDKEHRVASGLNHLFVKDNNGYYSYNSAQNYAYYNSKNKDNKDFVVYDRPLDRGSDARGDFMPLQDFKEGKKSYYGMTVGFNFIQPYGGLINGQPMMFEFSGDDDVWVFVDGKLVLDIGGIHGATKGSINFSTGEVEVEGVVRTSDSGITGGIGKSTTLKNIFDLSDRTFDDYTEHRLEFIYLERGAGESNCNLKFNIQTIPKQGITVQKQIDNYDEGAYTDVEFQFKLYLENQNRPGSYYQVTDGVYEVKRSGSARGQILNLKDSGGIFKLKHGEMAIFEQLAQVGTKYYVQEIGMNQDEYDDVKITGSSVTDEYGKIDYSQDSTNVIVQSHKLQIGYNPYIVFHNRCSATNMKQLMIKKELQGAESSAEEFEVQVKVGGTLYKGEYKSNFTDGVKSTENGKIKIKPNETITILGNVKTSDGKKVGFPSGTSFEVEEINYDSNAYELPLYEIVAGTADNSLTEEKASGKFTKDKNANVVITNRKKGTPPGGDDTNDVPHHKYIDYLGDGGENRQTELRGDEYYRLYLDAKGIPNVEPEPADIVLILDYSSSMHNEFGNSTRWDYVKKSANLAINTLIPNYSGIDENKKNHIGIVWFDKRANEKNIKFTSDKNALLKNVFDMKYNSGTNYQAAFWNAQKMLATSSGRKQFVIFVTDGEPYQYYKNNMETEDNLASDGSDKAKKAAVEAAKLFKDLDGFYAVSVGKDTGTSFLRNDISGNVDATIRDTIVASNEEELEEAFKAVLGSITKQIGNVTIEDTLSDYVTFADEEGAVDLIERYDNNHDGILKGSVENGRKDSLAQSLGLAVNTYRYNKDTYDSHADIKNAEEYGGSYTYEIDLNNKSIKVNFGTDYFLERDVVYTISFNVKLTEKATKEAAEEQGTFGDANTDYPENSTSSEKKGLYSNESASITYERIVDGKKESESKPYEKPVVQPCDRSWKIIKENEAGSLKLEGATFTLKNDQFSYTGVSGKDGVVKWIQDGKELTSQDIEAGTYTLKETIAPKGYLLSEQEWIVKISVKGAKPEITCEGKKVELERDENGAFIMKVKNSTLYELPSSGGNGIYWYIVSGVLLLTAAGMLILYKSRRKEVLGS